MEQNSQIVGVSATLELGIATSSRKGKILHPLLVGKRKLLGEGAQVPLRLAAVAAMPLALWLGMNSAEFLPAGVLGQKAHEADQIAQLSRPTPVSAESRRAGQLSNEAARGERNTDQKVSGLQAEQPQGDGMSAPKPQAAPLPGMPMPGGFTVAPSPYPIPANAEFVNPATIASKHVQSVETVASKPAASSGKDKSTSMLVMDVSDGAAKTDAPKSTSAAAAVQPGLKQEPAKVDGTSSSAEPAVIKDAKNDGSAPNVKLPSLKDAPAEAKASKDIRPVEVESMAKAEAPKAKVVQPKESPIPKKQASKTVVAREEEPLKEAKRSSTQRDGKLFDEGDEGFAEPIRMRSVGGGKETQRATPTRGGSSAGGVEVIDVTNNSVIVTNPKTNLPMQVRVGGRLPNGQVVTHVDRQSGSVQTSGGVLRAN